MPSLPIVNHAERCNWCLVSVIIINCMQLFIFLSLKILLVNNKTFICLFMQNNLYSATQEKTLRLFSYMRRKSSIHTWVIENRLSGYKGQAWFKLNDRPPATFSYLWSIKSFLSRFTLIYNQVLQFAKLSPHLKTLNLGQL